MGLSWGALPNGRATAPGLPSQTGSGVVDCRGGRFEMFHAAADQSYVGAGLSQRARDATGDTGAAASHKCDETFQNSICEDFHKSGTDFSL